VEIRINTYNNLKRPIVESTIEITEWLEQIKQKNQYSDRILLARHNPEVYDSIKGSIPCVTYNFQYNGYKNDENIIQSTGLIYIDIDSPEFNINTLDRKKVYSYYHSFGGDGYAVLVKVSGVTHDNFKVTYQYIVKDLEIEDYIDTRAIKPSQFNVLSFDEDLYLNNNSNIYSGIPAPPSIYLNKENTYTIDGVAKSNIRFDNLDDIEVNGNYMVNWEGYEYIRCFIPFRKVKKGNRNPALISYCNNLVYLNQHISFEKTLSIMNAVNERMCQIPLEKNEILHIIQSVFKYLRVGSLNPIYHKKKRKIVFNPDARLSKEEKLEICRQEIAQHRRGLSEQKLYDIIENWDFKQYGKITQRAIFLNHPVSKKTVGKYWNVLRDLVDEVNKGKLSK
jgi:hypothetical protein